MQIYGTRGASGIEPVTVESQSPPPATGDSGKLENKYELLAGGLKGEAVACHGDSGGPLLRGITAPTLTTYGVSFAVEGTISSACGLGGGYLVFNTKMLTWVKAAVVQQAIKAVVQP